MSTVDKIKEIEAEVRNSLSFEMLLPFLDGSYSKKQKYCLSFGYAEG